MNRLVCMEELKKLYGIKQGENIRKGVKGTLKVKGTPTNVWDEAEINYIKDDGKKEIQKIKMVNHPGAGFSHGFYRDFIQFLKGKEKKFVTMYEGSKVVKILDLIKRSSEEKRYISF